MDPLKIFKYIPGTDSERKFVYWSRFLQEQQFDFSSIQSIDLLPPAPLICDHAGRKFSIDFNLNHLNYQKKKLSLKSELISRALGAGANGLRLLDLTAGLGIDAVFLAQQGFQVTAIERNPLIYLSLENAWQDCQDEVLKINLKFIFQSAKLFLNDSSSTGLFDLIYFDPMFPEKRKSALPRQEMVFFKNLVGSDEDAAEVLTTALAKASIHRVVVKRPLKAGFVGDQVPQSQIKGKLIRYDIYLPRLIRHPKERPSE